MTISEEYETLNGFMHKKYGKKALAVDEEIYDDIMREFRRKLKDDQTNEERWVLFCEITKEYDEMEYNKTGHATLWLAMADRLRVLKEAGIEKKGCQSLGSFKALVTHNIKLTSSWAIYHHCYACMACEIECWKCPLTREYCDFRYDNDGESLYHELDSYFDFSLEAFGMKHNEIYKGLIAMAKAPVSDSFLGKVK